MSFTVSPPRAFESLDRRLSNLRTSQLPFATALALTETAKAIREAEKVEMARVFDRPTPFTLNAFAVVPATKQKLVAEVRYKDVIPYSGRHFLEVQAEGGARRPAAWESHILGSGAVMGLGLSAPAIIPARAAQRDAFGNWSRGERNRVLSALQAQRDTLSNTTDRSRRRNPRRADYYVGRRGTVTGVFRQRGDEDDLILLFLNSQPTYRKLFDFHGVAERTARAVFATTFARTLEDALRTSMAHAGYKGRWMGGYGGAR